MMLRMRQEAQTTLIGRDSETLLLRGLVERVRERGSAMLVRGEAGVGKSALLTEASRIAEANGVRSIWTVGVESEAHLPFAGLHRLVRPLISQSDDLPGRQRDALLAAFGMQESVAADLFLIALATLNLLAEAAGAEPMLLVVDDFHWLDPSTADVLRFVARRVDFEPIVLLAAIREGFHGAYDDARLPQLFLNRLENGDAGALLDAHAPALPQALRRRLLVEAAGNPLALVELPRAVAEIGDGFESTAWLPLTARVEQSFAARVSGLPAVTTTLLLAAALNDDDLVSEALEATAIVCGKPVTVQDLGPAVEVRLVEVDGERLRFRHPLMRTAIHQRSTIGQRRAAHTALAQVVEADVGRRAWHRAAAGDGPDEAIAADLEDSAVSAQRRGAVDAAVSALERAASLSVDPVRRGERLLRAAELAFEMGRPGLVRGLIRQSEAIELSNSQQSRVLWIRERFDDGIHGVPSGARLLTEAAERAASDGDKGLAWRLLWGAALRCFWSEPGPLVRTGVVAAAERLRDDSHDGRPLAIIAFAAPIERGAVVIDELRWLSTHSQPHQRFARLADAAMLVGAFDLAGVFCAPAIAELRAQARLGLLARCLAAQAWSAAQLGDLSSGIPAAEEAKQLTGETMQPIMHATALATQAMLAAVRGEQDRVDELSGDAERASLRIAARPVLATVQHARGLAALAAGRYVDAYEHLCRMYDPRDLSYHVALRCFAVGDLVEAAVRAGLHDAVCGIVDGMEALARTTPSPALHAGLRYARALLADDTDAEELFREAIGAGMPAWSFARARAQLAYGGWLRRRRRSADSRAPLRAAREAFDALGTIPWSERARQELRASGEVSRGRKIDARDQLTPQELQIAQLAAAGLTNREIGERLYLSHRTVSSHLHRIFPKLGITTRAALDAVLGAAHELPGGQGA